MANKRIGELTAATEIDSTSLFAAEQNGTAKKVTAQLFENWLLSFADGHGGIQRIQRTSSQGSNPIIDTYTITYADQRTTTFTVTNGTQGEHGEKGDPGETLGIKSHAVAYAASTSGSVVPVSGWVNTPPTVPQGSFLWTRNTIIYDDDTDIVFYSIARSGIDGSGSVGSVNNVSPDAGGNVSLQPSDIGAADADDVAASATVSAAGVISFKNSSNVEVFNVQLPIFTGV